ncbi:hypothetical protein MKZ38_002910 [Zalerion maritima]|uniref:DNA mismatch repair protein MSH5 n=1 Tax=Zalerion maritima TaxID=339359 RepID=A0AAD5WQZ0_9PEZI|nr:hypothetical protein MKZ38_002910 [Zalerion maritima]
MASFNTPIASDPNPSSTPIGNLERQGPASNYITGDPFGSSPSQPRRIHPGSANIDALDPASQDDADSLSNQDSDALGEVIMATDIAKSRNQDAGRAGCAYYVAAQETLYLIDDVVDGVDIVELMLSHAQPTTVIVTTHASRDMVTLLSRHASHPVNASDDSNRGAYILRQIGSGEFSYEAAIQRLLTVAPFRQSSESGFLSNGPGESNHESPDGSLDFGRGKLMNLGALINLDSTISVGCAGAVLGDLQRKRAAQYPSVYEGRDEHEEQPASFVVKGIEMLSFADYMFVNGDTLAALQIMGSEAHPNRYSQTSKESLSLFGLFKPHAVTYEGRFKLRQMFLRPSIDLAVIHERQRTISTFLHPENQETIDSIHRELMKIPNVRTMMAYLRRGIDFPSQGASSMKRSVWAALATFSGVFLQINDRFQHLSGAKRLHILPRTLYSISRDAIVQVGEIIGRTIDFEQSQDRLRTAVARGVDPDLDAMKREYDGMERFLTDMATNVNREIPQWAQKHVQHCIFFPQIGFLTVVVLDPETGRGRYEGDGSRDPSWDFLFEADGNAYYKNEWMRDLDSRFGDMYCAILDREIELLHDIAVQVLEHEKVIIAAYNACGELDSLVALALGARLYNWTQPRVVDEKMIEIREGRHALQERVVQSFIPNDCKIEQGVTVELVQGSQPDRPSILVLTGPNHSGKSIYLKQVALIVYLAHIGSHVPATRAVIGLTDRLLTRISTRESICRDQSAFAIDLKQVAFSLSFATKRSLVLVDEFGKGTGPADGAGLITALLQHFQGLGPACPRVLAATHFHEVFENGFVKPGPSLRLAHMEVRLDLGTTPDEDDVTYMYKLRDGRSSSSFGSWCARMNGVEDEVVKRAESIVLLLSRNEDLACVSANLTEQQAGALQESEELARRFLELDFSKPISKESGPAPRDVLGSVLNR